MWIDLTGFVVISLPSVLTVRNHWWGGWQAYETARDGAREIAWMTAERTRRDQPLGKGILGSGSARGVPGNRGSYRDHRC